MSVKEDDDFEFSALEPDIPKRPKKSIKWLMLLPILISLGVLTYHGSYSPTSNFIKYTIEYFTTTELEFDFENDIKYLNLTESNSTKPNLVFILNESMGNYLGMYPNGTNINSTYFNKQIKNQKDFFVMNNARGVSGNTETATPGIFMGRYIVSEKNTQETKSYFKIDSMMSLAKANGYKTALFCAYQTHFSHGWKQLNSVFDQFDMVVSQSTLNAEVVNDYGMDDRNLTTRILNYLDTVDPNQPFLLTIIWNNLHFPFLVGEDFAPPDDTEEERDRARYAHSIGLTDMMMGSVMDSIKRKQILNNTIISFSADHGETPGDHARIAKPTSRVLSVPLWFHIPNYFLTRTQRQNLRWNAQNGTISTLDMVPTLIDVMKWKDIKDLYPPSNATVHGQSLLNKLPENRWISGWAGPPFVPNCDWRHAFIANKTHVYWIHSWLQSYTLEINNGPNFALVNSTSSFELEELQNMQKELRLPREMLLPTCYGDGLF
ncbi:alkaline-phosphatase-like protein [Globomyces pollinis-pini]|nr:alkaline-phosphatase-like protein [Globomyces pollinis-pini]